MNELNLIIPGSVRSKKNSKQIIMVGGKHCPKRPVMIPSKAHKAWEDAARKAAWPFAIIPPLTCPVHIEAQFYCKGQLPDLSGAMESLADMLEGIVYADDSQIVSWDGSRVWHDKDRPRVEVKVRWVRTNER